MKKELFLGLAVGVSVLFNGPATAAEGKDTYNRFCVACHGSGAANSPKFGDKQAWAPRIAKGMDALMKSALGGVAGTAMLPKGTCNSCTDEDLKKAVEYMVNNSK